MKFKTSWLAISLAVAAASGCGGGGGADSLVPTNAGGVTRIVAFGDSLSDPGAYALAAAEKQGGRFTVNSPGSRVWTELVAADYGLPLLPNQVVTDAGPQLNPNGTSYAEGGSRVTRVSQSAAEQQAVANAAMAAQANLRAVLIDQVNVDGLITTQFPCPPSGFNNTQFTKSVFGVTPAGDVDTPPLGSGFNPNLAGCVQREAVPLSATNSAITIEAVYPKDNAGIGYYVSNLSNSPANLLGAPNPGLKTRSGITTLPITEQTARFVPTTVVTAVPNADKSLVTVLGGANDLFTIIGLINSELLPAPSADPTNPNATNQAVALTAVRLAQEVGRLNARGFNKILVGNIPDLSKTPFLETSVRGAIAKAIISGIPANADDLAVQADIRNDLVQLFQGVTLIFNTALAQALAADPTNPAAGPITGVKILDLFTLFDRLLPANADARRSALSARGLDTTVDQTRVTACRQGAIGSETGAIKTNPRNLPLKTTNSSLFCNQDDLVAPNADRTYLFADGVHPTPKGHELIAEEALRVLRAAGWR